MISNLIKAKSINTLNRNTDDFFGDGSTIFSANFDENLIDSINGSIFTGSGVYENSIIKDTGKSLKLHYTNFQQNYVLPNTYTLSFYVKFKLMSNEFAVVLCASSSIFGFEILRRGNILGFVSAGFNGPGSVIDVNKTYNVVIDSNKQIWINKVQITTNQSFGWKISTPNNVLKLGNSIVYPDSYNAADCNIDNLKIFNKILTQGEIDSLSTLVI